MVFSTNHQSFITGRELLYTNLDEDSDRLIRMALKEGNTSGFKNLMEETFIRQRPKNNADMTYRYSFNETDYYRTLLNKLRIIACLKNDTEKFAVIDQLIERPHGLRSYLTEDYLIQLILMSSIPKKPGMLRLAAAAYSIVNNTLEVHDLSVSLLNNPVYWIMVTGIYKDDPEIIKDMFPEESSYSNELYVSMAVMSAAVFKDHDFLEYMFTRGYSLKRDTLIDLIFYPETVSYLSEKFGKYIFPEKYSGPQDIRAMLRFLLSDQDIVNMIEYFFNRKNNNTMQDFSWIPKIGSIHTRNSCFIRSPDAGAIAEILYEPEVKVIVDVFSDISDLGKYIPSKLTYYVEPNVVLNSEAVALQLLKMNAEFGQAENGGLSTAVKSMIGLNNKMIYYYMIKQGLINDDNLGAVLSELTGTRNYKGLLSLYQQINGEKT